MGTYQHAEHAFGPVFDATSQILILGSFPSVKSREASFYYHHPQNRFWRLLSLLYEEPFPEAIPERKALLLRHHIALWDVIDSCNIIGSSDTSIRYVKPVDITSILQQTKIEKIYGNGSKACHLYRRYCEKACGVPIHPLPSTSPANAAWSLSRLQEAWSCILESKNAP